MLPALAAATCLLLLALAFADSASQRLRLWICPGTTERSPGRRESSESPTGLSLGRRQGWLAALWPGLALPASARERRDKARPARDWQLFLPEDWNTVTNESTVDLKKTSASTLLVTGSQFAKAEAKLTYVPLAGKGSSPTVDFFISNNATKSKDEVAELLSRTFARKQTTFSFTLGQVSETSKGNLKYLRYEFDRSRCDGLQKDSASGKVCITSGNDVLQVRQRHYVVVNTVTRTDDGGPQALWQLEISASSETWQDVSPKLDEAIQSFTVGSVA